jgi:hypothetical protein
MNSVTFEKKTFLAESRVLENTFAVIILKKGVLGAVDNEKY